MSSLVSTIHYVDYLPGTGKTYWITQRLVRYLFEFIDSSWRGVSPKYDEFPQLVYYVAPTLSLIEEVKDNILYQFSKYLDSLDTSKREVYTKIAYRESMRETYISDAASRLKMIISKNLENHTKYSRVRDVIGQASKHYNFNIKRSKEEIKAGCGTGKYYYKFQSDLCLYELDDSYENDYSFPSEYRYSPGSIVFITQTAFWEANHNPRSKNKTFWNKGTTQLVIDEARSSYCTSIDFNLTDVSCPKIEDLLSKNSANQFIKISSSFFDEKTLESLKKGMIRDKYDKLVSFVKDYQGSSFYIRIAKSIKAKTSCITIAIVQIPYEALCGWKDVILMSAFFKDSQLYYLLKSADQFDSTYKFRLKKETRDIDVLSKNEQNMYYRCRDSTITYIYDNDSYISKKMYSKAIAVIAEKADASLVARRAKISLAQFRHNEKTKNEFSRYANVTDFVKSHFVHNKNELDDITKLFRKYNPKIIFINPLEFAIFQSIRYTKAWVCQNYTQFITGRPFDTEFAKNNILINYNKHISNTYSDIESKLPDTLKEYYTSLTIDARGTNKYDGYKIISVLAANNNRPAVDAWFAQYIPDYDSKQDLSLSQCIQTMLRCNIRKKDSSEKVLIIVSTKGLAQAVAERLKSEVTHPKDILKDKYKPYSLVQCANEFEQLDPEVQAKIREKRRETTAIYQNSVKGLTTLYKTASKELSEEEILKKAYLEKYFDSSDLCKKYSYLNMAKSYNKRILKNDLTNLYVKEKLQSIEEELNDVKKKRKSLRESLIIDFRIKFKQNKEELSLDVKDYIEKVQEKHEKRAQYLKNKLESKLIEQEQTQTKEKNKNNPNVVEIPWEE